MIPLKDNVAASTTPFVNYTVIVLCALVFLLEVSQGERGREAMIWTYGMVPARITHPGEPLTIQQPVLRRTAFGVDRVVIERRVPPPPMSAWWTVLTCIFLHGGWLHIIGNMWFLFIFGDNVEDRFGHLGYALFYLLSGVIASLAHLATNPGSTLPTVGASGAIAGVMGAYMLLYPHARVLTAVPIFYFLEIVMLPAPIFLGIWFLLQAFQGTFSITAAETGGVAWWAHIGGFAAGFGTVLVLRATRLLRPARPQFAPPTSGWRRYRMGPRW